MEELGAVDGEDVNVGSFRDVLGKTACVLRPNVLVRITEQVGKILSSGSKREVGICGKHRPKT